VLLQVLNLGLIVLARHDGAAPAEIGAIVGCMGGGGLAGAFAAPWFQARIPVGITITGCMWIWTVLLALIVLVRVPLWLCPIVAIFGFVGPSWNVSVQTYRMRITPKQLLGRTSSVAVQIAWGATPLGSLLAGFLLQALSPSAAMTVVAAGDGGHRRRGHRPGADPSRRPRRPAGSAEFGGECRQVEQVKQRVAPPLPRRPVIEMPEAFVRRVQDRPQHRALVTLRLPEARLGAVRHRQRCRTAGLALQDRRRLPRHGQPECPCEQRPLHHQDAIVVFHSACLHHSTVAVPPSDP